MSPISIAVTTVLGGAAIAAALAFVLAMVSPRFRMHLRDERGAVAALFAVRRRP